jgi:hypothetical protein
MHAVPAQPSQPGRDELQTTAGGEGRLPIGVRRASPELWGCGTAGDARPGEAAVAGALERDLAADVGASCVGTGKVIGGEDPAMQSSEKYSGRFQVGRPKR